MKAKWLKRIGVLCLLLAACVASAAAPKPNILILLADDMGYGDPGCYNPKSKIATPHIDRLAREGMRFTDAHAPGPLCHPSRYGLETMLMDLVVDPDLAKAILDIPYRYHLTAAKKLVEMGVDAIWVAIKA